MTKKDGGSQKRKEDINVKNKNCVRIGYQR